MPLNRATIGKCYDAGPPFDVSRQKIREFATAIGDDSLIYADAELARAIGHPDVPAPPTFASVPSLLMGQGPRLDPDVGLDYGRVVHGEQRIELRRPIYAGDTLRGEVTIVDIRDVGANELLEICCLLRDREDQEVCRVTSLLISRGTAGGGSSA